MSFLAAVQFLTRIPVTLRHADDRTIGASRAFFPLVGGLIGAFLAGLDILLRRAGIPALPASALEVAVLAAVTGGLHLDGLADTADALMSGSDREGMLRIMRDPHTGAMGTISVVLLLLLKVVFLSAIDGRARCTALILMCALGRWSMAYAIQISPYARPNGKARSYFAAPTPGVTACAGSIALSLSLVAAGIPGAALCAAATAVGHLITRTFGRILGGSTGDTLGATDELIETAVVVTIGIALSLRTQLS